MELFNVKLNRTWGVLSQIKADFAGVTVIPPGNFNSSKEKGCPKSDGVRDRFNCLRTNSIKDDLNTLKAGEPIKAYLESGRTPNTT